MAKKFDAIIIGTGQAGPSLAARMTREGMNCAIIERKLFGGTCVNVGCIPTKALVASARAAHMARRGADFGVTPNGPVTVDMARVNARMKQISGASNQGVEQWLEGTEGVTVLRGHARFESQQDAGYIFNLGSGILPPTAPESMEAVFRVLRARRGA